MQKYEFFWRNEMKYKLIHENFKMNWSCRLFQSSNFNWLKFSINWKSIVRSSFAWLAITFWGGDGVNVKRRAGVGGHVDVDAWGDDSDVCTGRGEALSSTFGCTPMKSTDVWRRRRWPRTPNGIWRIAGIDTCRIKLLCLAIKYCSKTVLRLMWISVFTATSNSSILRVHAVVTEKKNEVLDINNDGSDPT